MLVKSPCCFVVLAYVPEWLGAVFFSSRRRHTRLQGDWSSDVCSSDLRGRSQLATARVKAPALGQWHTVRVVALGDHIQAWLDGKLYLVHHDRRYRSGRVGLWTKADSVTAFDDLTIRGVGAGG